MSDRNATTAQAFSSSIPKFSLDNQRYAFVIGASRANAEQTQDDPVTECEIVGTLQGGDLELAARQGAKVQASQWSMHVVPGNFTTFWCSCARSAVLVALAR
jgi:hypothetical protein